MFPSLPLSRYVYLPYPMAIKKQGSSSFLRTTVVMNHRNYGCSRYSLTSSFSFPTIRRGSYFLRYPLQQYGPLVGYNIPLLSSIACFSTSSSSLTTGMDNGLSSLAQQGDIQGILRSYKSFTIAISTTTTVASSSSSSVPSLATKFGINNSLTHTSGNNKRENKVVSSVPTIISSSSSSLSTVLPVSIRYMQALRQAMMIHTHKHPSTTKNTFTGKNIPSSLSTYDHPRFIQLLQDITHTFSSATSTDHNYPSSSKDLLHRSIQELTLLASLANELIHIFPTFSLPSNISSPVSVGQNLVQQIIIQLSDKCIQLLTHPSVQTLGTNNEDKKLVPWEPIQSIIHSVTSILRTFSHLQRPHLPFFDTIFTWIQAILQNVVVPHYVSFASSMDTQQQQIGLLQNLHELGTLFLWWNTNNQHHYNLRNSTPFSPSVNMDHHIVKDNVGGTTVASTVYEGNQAYMNEQTYQRYTTGIVTYYKQLVTIPLPSSAASIGSPVLSFDIFYGSILLHELSSTNHIYASTTDTDTQPLPLSLQQLSMDLLSSLQSLSFDTNNDSVTITENDFLSSIQQSLFTFTPANLVTGLTLLNQQFSKLPEHPFAMFTLPEQQAKFSSLVIYHFFLMVADEIKYRLQRYEKKYLDGYFNEWNNYDNDVYRAESTVQVSNANRKYSTEESTTTSSLTEPSNNKWFILSSLRGSGSSAPTLDAASYAYAQKLRSQYILRSTTINPSKLASLVTEIGFRVPDVSTFTVDNNHRSSGTVPTSISSAPSSTTVAKTTGWASMSQKMSTSSATVNKMMNVSSAHTFTVPVFLCPLPMYSSVLFTAEKTGKDSSRHPVTLSKDIISEGPGNASLATYRARVSSTGVRIHYRFHPSQLLTIAKLCIPSSYPPVANIPSLIPRPRLQLAVLSNDILHSIGLVAINYALTGETNAIDEVRLLSLYSHYGILHRGFFACIARRIVARGTMLPSRLSHLPTPVLVSYLYAFSLGWEFDQDVFTVIFRELIHRRQSLSTDNAQSKEDNDANNTINQPFPYMVAPEYEWSRGLTNEEEREKEIMLASTMVLPLPISAYFTAIILPTLKNFSSFGKSYIDAVSSSAVIEEHVGLNSTRSSVASTVSSSTSFLSSSVQRDPSLFPLYFGGSTDHFLTAPFLLPSSVGTTTTKESTYLHQQNLHDLVFIVSSILEMALTNIPSQFNLMTSISSQYNKSSATLASRSSIPLFLQPQFRTLIQSLFDFSGRSHSTRSTRNENANNDPEGEYVRNIQNTLYHELSVQDMIHIDELLQKWYTLPIVTKGDTDDEQTISSSRTALILPLCLTQHKIAFEPIVTSSAITLSTPFRASLRNIITDNSVASVNTTEENGRSTNDKDAAEKVPSFSASVPKDAAPMFTRSLFFPPVSSSVSSSSKNNQQDIREHTARTIHQAGILPSLSTMYRSTVLNSLGYTYIGMDMGKIFTILESTKENSSSTKIVSSIDPSSRMHKYSSIGYQQVAQYIASLLPSYWRA